MQLGGAVGNMIDRLTNDGQVTDFVSVGNFAIFNVADASISVGVVVLLLGMWLRDRSEQRERREQLERLRQQSAAGSSESGEPPEENLPA